MAQLLIKIGDNFPHKDLMLSLRTTDAGAKTIWIEREAAKLSALRQYAQVKLTKDQQIAIATSRWESQCAYKQGEIVNIRKDDAPLGKRESYPRFWLARIDDAKLLETLADASEKELLLKLGGDITEPAIMENLKKLLRMTASKVSRESIAKAVMRKSNVKSARTGVAEGEG